jgi:DHA1 family bicyclomycin/chloramphenicol resistance-like MFS transporter
MPPLPDAPTTVSNAPTELPTVRRIGLVVLLGSLTALDPLSIDMYLPSFPSIQRSFGTSISQVELSLSFFFVGMALGQLVYGPLSDRFGRRRPLLAGMALYLVSAAGCALSGSIGSLIAFRFLQALGGSAGMVISRAVVRDLFETQRAAQVFSALMLVMGVAPIIAPLAGGYVNAAFGWHAIFVALAILSGLNLLTVGTFLKETHRPAAHPVTLRSSLKAYGELFRDQRFLGYTLAGGAVRAGMFAYIAGSPFVFIELFHIPPTRYGWIFGANAVGLIASSQLNGLLLRRFRVDALLAASLSAALGCAAGLLLLPWAWGSLFAILIPLFFFLATLGYAGPNSAASALGAQGHRAGTASALYGTLQWLIAFAASFLVSVLHDGTSVPMRAVIFGCGAVAFLGYRLLVRPAAATRP